MHFNDFIKVSRKYKKCPNCEASYKDTKIQITLENEIITIKCKCGFYKQVDKNNNIIKGEN